MKFDEESQGYAAWYSPNGWSSGHVNTDAFIKPLEGHYGFGPISISRHGDRLEIEAEGEGDGDGEDSLVDLANDLGRVEANLEALDRRVAELSMSSEEPTPSPIARRVERILCDSVGSVALCFLAVCAGAVSVAAAAIVQAGL